MALGAERGNILRMVIGEAAVLTLLGLAIGLLAAVGLTRFMASLLFEVSPTDPLTLAGVSVFLIAVSLLASYSPARRAARVDPLATLRFE